MLRARTILLPEDDELRQAVQTPFFQRGGLDLIVVQDGIEVLSRIEQEDPAVVVLPLPLAGVSGDECCRRIKADPLLRKTPVVLVGSSDALQKLECCTRSGCDELLVRPVTAESLLAAVCRQLGISPRLDERMTVSLDAVCGPVGKELKRAEVVELSSGGLFLQASRLYTTGTELEIELKTGEENLPLRLRGRVVWVNHPEWEKAKRLPPGMGVAFAELEPQVRTALQAMMRRGEEEASPS